ncbi:hypothetical protein [Parahaliea mediterranea]|uniref:hypothetical protein n=1 Tax=Parahaliea mediterranea TaxID=651086 RepID=UPI000E2FE3C9|nr:hypothetical protein [Parahaliea mediterranea]
MDDRDKTPKDSETVLMALDQISQTIDVMTSVVGRLRTYVQEEAASAGKQPNLQEEMRPDRVLH